MKKRISISNEKNSNNNNKNILNDNEINSFINLLNSEIKSHYKLINQCVIEGKNDIQNKIINIDNYLKIEKYLNFFIEKTKNIILNLNIKKKIINNNNNSFNLSTLSKSNSNSNIKIKKNDNKKNKIIHRTNINSILFNTHNSYTNLMNTVNSNINNNSENKNNSNKSIRVKRNISQPSYSKTYEFNIEEKFLNMTKDIIDFIEILNKEKKNILNLSIINDKKLIYEKIIKELSNLAEILLKFKEINRNNNIFKDNILNKNQIVHKNKINENKNINIQILEKKFNEKINLLSKNIEEKNLLISELKIENEQLKKLNSENKITINNLNDEISKEKINYEKKISDYISINKKLENNLNIIKYNIKTHYNISPENFLILYEKIYENLKFYLISSKNENVINYDNTFFIPEIYLIYDINEYNKFNKEKDIKEEYLKDIKNIENKWISKIEKYEDSLSKLKEENIFLLNKINKINNNNNLNSAHTSLIKYNNLKDEFNISNKENLIKSSKMLNNLNLNNDNNNLSFDIKNDEENINYKDFIESEINNNSIINENKLFQLKNLFILLLNDISYNKNLKNILTNIFTLLDFSKEEINEMLNNKIKKGNLLNYLKNKTLIYK